MSGRSSDELWRYHDVTKHSYRSIRSSPHRLDWVNMPFPFKVYPGIDPLPLSDHLLKTSVPALTAISSDSADESDSEVIPTLDQLTSLLYYSAGVTKKKDYPGGALYFRAAACAGALYPTEVYIVCSAIDGLDTGVYHFNPGDFAIRLLRKGEYRNVVIDATGSEPHVARAPLLLVYSAISWRSSWKYRERAYRYHYWDAGMMVANALALSSAHGLPAHLAMGFVDTAVEELIGIDGKAELALGILALGRTAADLLGQGSREVPTLEPETIPLSGSQVDYPLIYESHRASSLTDEEAVVSWRRSKPALVGYDHGSARIPLERMDDRTISLDTLEEVVMRRASTRRFAQRPITLRDLSLILDRSTRGIPADFAGGAEALNEIYMIVNAVEGLVGGAYVYDRARHSLALIREGDFRKDASYLTLEQDLGGDASVTFFFMSDLGKVLGSMGGRGYRAVHMEAGVVGGRMYLAAYAIGRGATGLTFYDDDVTEFFSPNASGKNCIFVMALGVPGKRPLY